MSRCDRCKLDRYDCQSVPQAEARLRIWEAEAWRDPVLCRYCRRVILGAARAAARLGGGRMSKLSRGHVEAVRGRS